MNPFLLLVVITVATPDAGAGVATQRLYMPDKAMCEAVKTQIRREHNWIRQRRDSKGKVTSTLVYSIVKASCLPWAVGRQPGDDN